MIKAHINASFYKPALQWIQKGGNHHLNSYHTDVVVLGILTAVFSFIIVMFLNATLSRNATLNTTTMPQPQLHFTNTYKPSHLSTVEHDQQEDAGIQPAREVILTSIQGEFDSAQAEEVQETNIAFQGQGYKVRRTMNITMTAYSSTRDQTDSTPFITASNTRVNWGTVATNFLPFKTKIRIPGMFGDKVFVVEDRMNKRYWHRVDVWMPTRQEAINFGIRTLKIEILEPVPTIQRT